MYRLRRLGWFVAGAFAALTLGGCAPVKVNSFVERGADFKRYRTYNWAPDDQLSTGDPRLDNNTFFLERLQADVEKQLASRGFEKATAGTPDLQLHYHARVRQRLDMNGADQTYGRCEGCVPYVYDAGTLLLDFVDTRSNTLVWRGWAEGSLAGAIDNQAWMEETLDDAVARILTTLPPRL
jgi:hypothetical protein